MSNPIYVTGNLDSQIQLQLVQMMQHRMAQVPRAANGKAWTVATGTSTLAYAIAIVLLRQEGRSRLWEHGERKIFQEVDKKADWTIGVWIHNNQITYDSPHLRCASDVPRKHPDWNFPYYLGTAHVLLEEMGLRIKDIYIENNQETLKPWEKFLHVLFAPTASDRKFEEITQLGTKSKIEKAKLEQELTELQSQEAALRKQEADIRKQLDTIGQKIDEKKKLLMNP